MFYFSTFSIEIYILIFGIFGLLIGSFLNVVIYRKPKMMEQSWRLECQEILEIDNDLKFDKFTLSRPRSACPKCDHNIRWFENIPVFSYLFLKGRCSSCHVSIGLRYPMIEILTGLIFSWCGYKYGFSLQALIWCGFSALMIALTFIDWDTHLLPDDINYCLLWLGLLGSVLGLTSIIPSNAVIGALVGYLSLWSVSQIFYIVTKKHGIGNGDFKLYAALGAWFGWQALIPIILLASLVGAVVGVTIKLVKKEGMDVPMPFGPFLTGAGFFMMLLGTDSVLYGMAAILG